MLRRMAKAVIDRHSESLIESAVSQVRDYEISKLLDSIAQAVLDLANKRHLTEVQRYELFYEIGRKVQPNFHLNDRGRYLLSDEAFNAYFERFNGTQNNWKSFDRKWNLHQLLRHVAGVPGDLAECGVFEGASAWQMCRFAKQHGRAVHLFDSYEGLSQPQKNDGSHWTKGGLSVSEETVRANLAEFDCFETYRGWIPEAFPKVSDKRYCFVHIDVDLEQPTRDSLAFFYPRVNAGGIILLDDHGYDTCPGARKAALEYMADNREPVIDLSTGQGLILKL